MTRWLPVVALGLLLALAAIILLRPSPEPTAAERADALAGQLRCPDCQGLSVADSPTRSAQEIRRQVDDLVASGASDDEVRERFVARYGEWILLSPSAPAWWLLPFAVVVGGAVALYAWLRRGAAVPVASPAAVGDAERRRLHEDAEALDA